MKNAIVFGFVCAAAGAALFIGGCSGGGGGGGGLPESVTFVVRDGIGNPVVAATIYLVPASAIDDTPFDSADVLSGASEDFDEPLEDAVRLNGGAYPQAVTDATGTATIGQVPMGSYFWFVSPDPGDTEHLPGGLGCRVARDTITFLGTTVDLSLTSSPGPGATHVGTSTCLACHPAYATMATHAHRLGFAVPGQLSALQDDSRYPDYRDGWNNFLDSAVYTGGTEIWLSDFDSSRGFDKFKTRLSDPAPLGETVYLKAYLWKDTADGKSKITLENMINPADPRSPWTLTVELTYGGAVLKQRHLVAVPGLNGRYPLLQIQTEGDESRFDRTRKVYRDYHMDWFWDAATNTFKDPPTNKAFEGNCTGCHSTGFSRFQDPVTMEWLSDAVDDINGAFDIDGDGSLDEINTGCESCHGAGSQHVNWAADPSNAGREGRYIVEPEKLSPSRAVMICGRCHGRPKGLGPGTVGEPLNAAGEMLPVGGSRADYLANYTSVKGPTAGSMWGDLLHSKSHRQQYEDFIKSTKHRNDRILSTCSDCHDGHGYAPYVHHLTADPDDPNSSLCASCHATDLIPHMLQETGATHTGNQTTCISCHMTNAAKTGAGRYGILLNPPTGTSSDPASTYFENDTSSHLFLTVPKKGSADVSGVLPASAMPIPYTASCGSPCHDASQLQFQTPNPEFPGGTLRALVQPVEVDDYPVPDGPPHRKR